MGSRERLPNEPPLLDDERAIRLAEEATAFFRAPGDGRHELSRLAVKTAMDAAHLALETAIDTGDPRVLDAALELATQRARGWGEERFEIEIALAASEIFPALTAMTSVAPLRDGLPTPANDSRGRPTVTPLRSVIDNRVRDCARSSSSFLRRLTAKGLGPRALRSLRGESAEADAEVDAEAAGIVFALTKDKDADVRAAAREALGGAAPPAWATFFPRDPLATLPAAEAARLRGPLDRAAEALEEGVSKDAAPLAEAIAELPDALATPILDAWMKTSRAAQAKGAEPLIERWLRLDPEGERTEAWLRSMGDDNPMLESGARVGALVKRLPVEHARAIGLRVAAFLTDDRAHPYGRMYGEGLLTACWPDEADPTPLLELALGAPIADAAALPDAEDASLANSTFVQLALAPATLEVLLEPLVDAFLAGLPGRWARLRYQVPDRLLEVAHPRLRAHAEALLREGEGAALTWALRYLTGGGHDPSVDPPVERFLVDAARDPRLRAALLGDPSLRAPGLHVLRAQLTSGELPPEEVISVAALFHVASDEASLRPEEWAAVRRARVLIEAPARRAAAVALLPAFARWTPEDRAFVDGLIDDHAHIDGVAYWIANGLVPGWEPAPEPALVPLLERLIARASAKASDAILRPKLAVCRGEDPWA
jgi:hypothetical protein